MKLIKIIIATTFIFVIFSLTACNSGGNNDKENSDTLTVEENIDVDETNNTENQSETVEDDKDYTSKYVCAMHCEGSGNHEAGNCPVCKMELIENLDYKE